MAEQKIARVITLGCRLNIADSSLMFTALAESGYRLSEELVPDVVVVNTCAVTAEAERKTRQTIRRLRREFPAARIVAAGCAADANAEVLERAGADFVCGNSGKQKLADYLRQDAPVWQKIEPGREVFREGRLASFPFRSRAFIKIQEGCDNFCTYCIVPLVRGPARSRDFGEVLAECKKALDDGFHELVMTGVNTCAYLDNGRRLQDLLAAVAELPGDFRIRIGSTEPVIENRGLIDAVAELPKMCRFLHLSLQHGCDGVLKRMHRHYTAAEYADFVTEAKRRIPGLHLGTDVIVGFPGENDAEFEASCRFIEKIGFANVHIFTYSPRPGTVAATMPDRPSPGTVRRRAGELRKIAETSTAAFVNSQIDRTLPVIFERIESGFARGWSDNYIEVKVPADGIPLGRIVHVAATADNLGEATGGTE